jgi:hypothetical protein
MEQARMERANNPDADKVRVGKIVRYKDKAEDATVVARVEVAAADADRAKVAAAVARDAVKILNDAKANGFYPSPTKNRKW